MSDNENSNSALVSIATDMPMDFTVIANSPAQMEVAQRQLILWAARRIQGIKNEIAEAADQLAQAAAHKWNTAAWRAQINKHERKAEFYRKIKMALEAGYYIVPPFPIDVFAIRTDRLAPDRKQGRHPNNHDQKARVLAVGKGAYVDPRPTIREYERRVTKKDGTVETVSEYYASGWKDPDFPFKLAKADIRSATEAAIGLGIFDELGVLPKMRAPDPIVCGRIIDPSKPGWYAAERAGVTFFVAWWLDTKTL